MVAEKAEKVVRATLNLTVMRLVETRWLRYLAAVVETLLQTPVPQHLLKLAADHQQEDFQWEAHQQADHQQADLRKVAAASETSSAEVGILAA